MVELNQFFFNHSNDFLIILPPVKVPLILPSACGSAPLKSLAVQWDLGPPSRISRTTTQLQKTMKKLGGPVVVHCPTGGAGIINETMLLWWIRLVEGQHPSIERLHTAFGYSTSYYLIITKQIIHILGSFPVPLKKNSLSLSLWRDSGQTRMTRTWLRIHLVSLTPSPLEASGICATSSV